MARQLYFGSAAIGTHYLRGWPDMRPQTPAAVSTGLYQQYAAVVSESQNLLSRWVFEVAIVGVDEIAAALALLAIQELQGTTDDLELREGETVLLHRDDWILDEVSCPQPAEGFGGRILQPVTIVVVGNSEVEVEPP